MSGTLPHLLPAAALINTLSRNVLASHKGRFSGTEHRVPITVLVTARQSFPTEHVRICRLALKYQLAILGVSGTQGRPGDPRPRPHPACYLLPSPAPALFGQLEEGPLCLCLLYGTSSDVHFPPCQTDVAQSTPRP